LEWTALEDMPKLRQYRFRKTECSPGGLNLQRPALGGRL